MKILSLFLFLVFLLLSARASASCELVADDGRRLACYDGVQACIPLTDAVARLACFDAIFGYRSAAAATANSATESQPVTMPEHSSDERMPVERSADSLPAEPLQSAAPHSPAAIVDETTMESADESHKTEKAIADDLKFPLPAPPPKEEDKVSITATITAVKTAPYDLHYLTLDNNQVWKEARKSRVRFKVGQSVTIKEGILGTQDLYVQGNNRVTKVKRIK